MSRNHSSFRRLVLLASLAASITLPAAAAGKDPLAGYWSVTGGSYPADAAFTRPAKWAAGQYVLTGTKTKGKAESVSRTLIVGSEKGGWIIETSETDRKGKKSVTQMLVYGYDEAAKADAVPELRIGWMKMKDENGQIQTIEGDQIAFFNMFAKSTLDRMIVNVAVFTEGGPVTVPAGTFAGTNYSKSSVKVLGMTVESEYWYNGAVPVNGIVKTQTTDGKSVTELLSFGSDGKPEL